MIHFSRLSEELILWAGSEFRFIEMADAFSTGSSIMPQKKNPDISELVRGKTGRVVGDLVSLLMLMKSLPMSYNRDMQEDKEPLFDAVDTLSACIDIYIRMLPTIRFNQERMYEAASTGYQNATDLADYLVNQGMPFRKAHSVAGQAVAHALDEGKELHELTLQKLKTFSKLIKKDIFNLLKPESLVNRRSSAGGTSAENVRKAISKATARLDAEMERLPEFKD
jgi:argininosuccinate lyase